MENNNSMKHLSVPSLSKTNQNKHSSSNHSSFTHPSVCPRSRDYLETIFKKINSGHNVLPRIPTRLDPNVEFSEDEDEEHVATVKTPADVVDSKNENFMEKAKGKSIPKDIAEILQTPIVPQSSRSLFNNALCTTDRKTRDPVKKHNESVRSKFSSASKVNINRVNSSEIRRTFSDSKEAFNEFAKPNLKTTIEPILNKPPECLQKYNYKESTSHKAYSLPSDIIEVNGKIYNVLSLLGAGGSCKVYSVYNVEDKSRVAVKRVDLKDTDPLIREGYKQEIEYLQRLQNSNRVIKMFDFEYRDNELLLVLEHGDTDFAKYISNEAKLKRVSPLKIKFFWVQMLEAVADIHKYGIIHSDLKPANFLLVAGNLKLIDFGIATSVPEDKTSTFRDTQVGTLNYMSPEAITQMSADSRHPCFKVGVKSDVWSLGCILYNLVYGVTPFHNIKALVQKIDAIINPKYEIPFKPLSDPLLLDVLKSCLKRNPKERASVEELLRHPYLAEDNSSSANALPLKPNPDLQNVLTQMQNLTPRRMGHVTKLIQQLSKKSDA